MYVFVMYVYSTHLTLECKMWLFGVSYTEVKCNSCFKCLTKCRIRMKLRNWLLFLSYSNSNVSNDYLIHILFISKFNWISFNFHCICVLLWISWSGGKGSWLLVVVIWIMFSHMIVRKFICEQMVWFQPPHNR